MKLQTYRTNGWLWCGTSLTVFVMIGFLYRIDEWKGNPSASFAWCVYHSFAQMLSGREEFWIAPFLWLVVWVVIAVAVGWLLHSLTVIMRPSRATETLVIALLVAGAAGLLLRHRSGDELNYEGRPIEHWFAQLPPTLVSSNSVGRAESLTILGQQYGDTGGVSQCFVALDTLGTNAIPYYLRKFQNSDSFLEQKAVRLAAQTGVRTVPFRNAAIERGQAVTALIHVKQLPPDTLQTLFKFSTNAQSDIALAAKYVLVQRGLMTHFSR